MKKCILFLLGRIIRQCRSLTLRMLLQFGRLIIIYLEVVLMYLLVKVALNGLIATGEIIMIQEIWLLKEDKDKYPGAWFFDTTLNDKMYGNCHIVFDNFLMRAYAIQK